MSLTRAIATHSSIDADHPATLASVLDLVAEDFDAVNHLIPRQLTSDVDMVEEIGRYIVDSGGKRLRPLLVLLGARCCGYEGKDHRTLAAIIEFLHTATLLHDDVVDTSTLRRGRATANALWGNAPSVLVGDFLYSRAFQLMVELADMNIMTILSDATNTIAEGEVLQLSRVGDSSLDEADYMEVIRCKTAMLFQAASHTAAVLASDDAAEISSLREFGVQFGLAYQLVDDWLDYAGDTATMGKNVGDDLVEGKLTLPLIHALAHTR
ncbi:MAG: polyprenyl synthetase family protein, partial [Pseudomonadales bacterium]|nr:polyprenyl synthetase family protein [Pseudomonadales bacterium]